MSKATFDMEAFQKKIYMFNQEISSKIDMVIMNQCRLNRFLLPQEKRIVRPSDLPALPLRTEEELNKFEKYLSKDDNATATVSTISFVIYFSYLFFKYCLLLKYCHCFRFVT